ncbi:MAG: class I SAM-dependent methyltransferase [Parvibaculaceae bacterium]
MSGETALETEIKRLIRADGPMPVERYMALCLTHPEHGYYTGRDPFGARGDFITAPEVSQVFGELIGVWCVTEWEIMGKPQPFSLVEFGPGRGTLMSDILRATRTAADFQAALAVHLLEASPVLADVQKRTLGGIGPKVSWHRRIEDLPSGPCLILANEFFDALPVRQLVRAADGWHERRVGLDTKDTLAFVADNTIVPKDQVPGWADDAALKTVIEIAPERENVASELGRRIAAGPGVALIVDYGHRQPAAGETLQAVRRHNHVHALEEPGLADLSSHVDFSSIAMALKQGGAIVHGPMDQGDFLTRMFIEERTEALKSRAALDERRQIDAAVRRLVASDQMGSLFKVLAACPPEQPVPYPFEEDDYG